MLKRDASNTRLLAVARLWAAAAMAATLCLAGCRPGGESEETPAGTESPSGTEAGSTTSAGLHVRQEIHQWSADRIVAYRKGVALMQGRAETDPTSWLYQANIHGYPPDTSICAPPTAPPQTAWATCQHGNFFFLSWHRIYLFYFERILRAAIREAVGDPDYEFALPYWDYENPAYHDLPEPFRVPADGTNPLYVAERVANCNDGQECVSAEEGSSSEAMTRVPFCNCGLTSCTGCQSGISSSMAFGSQFTSAPAHFARGFGELESQPHNVIHDVVGGPDGWMADVDCAARDPIFWLHHANIDRLWQVWLNQGGRANPLGADNWKTQQFTFFDENGQAVTMTGCDVLDMAAQLDYRYEGLPVENVQLCTGAVAAPREVPAPQAKVLAQAAAAVRLADAPAKVSVPVTGQTGERLRTLAAPGAPAGHVWLVIEGLKRLHRGAYYQVYLNLPDGQAPDPKGPHHVGNIALFGADHGGDAEIERAFDITDEIQDLRQGNLWRDQIELTFVRGNPEARAARRPDAFVTFRSVKVVER